jgi:hypothetical protein
VARCLVGLAGALILWGILGAVYLYTASAQPYSLTFLQYTLVGMWLSGLAPLAFVRLGLAKAKQA